MLFVANWKMNPPNLKEAKRLALGIGERVEKIKQGQDTIEKAIQQNAAFQSENTYTDQSEIKVVICPPDVYLYELIEEFKNPKGYRTKNEAKKKGSSRVKSAKSIKPETLDFGVQNIGFSERGAFTGDTSVLMAKDAGAKYCIIGHSERKAFNGENDERCNQKIKLCLENEITPIFCIGENEEQKNAGQTGIVLTAQLQTGLAKISITDVKKVIIAYEPVWAINSSMQTDTIKDPNPDDILGATIIIRKTLLSLYDQHTAREVQIIYGGSVTKDNVANYSNNNHLKGFLIGSAGLNTLNFTSLIENSLK
jgi:triosephosphate isomerase